MMVRRRRSGLHDVHILPAHILLDLDERFAVRKGADRAFGQLQADGGDDAPGQRQIGRAGKNFHN